MTRAELPTWQNQKLTSAPNHVVIVGAGFGGLSAAKALVRKKNILVTLIDKRNHHLFQPLLYQVATAGLNPADIAVPIRSQFSNAANVSVHMGEVIAVNLQEKNITVKKAEDSTQKDGVTEIHFDFLILACGAQHSYFGKTEWEEFAPGLKSLEQATEMRRRILTAFEAAENEIDPEKQKVLLTFAIVGGGPTGVELAGAIADISRTVLVKDFKRINPASARVVLVEAGSRILASFDEQLSRHAADDLKKLGVEVRTGVRVTNIDQNGIVFGNEKINAATVFWAAGVQASKLGSLLDVQTDKNGRVKVEEDLSVPQFPYAYVIGDMAAFELADKTILPGLAPVAIQQGRAVAQNISLTLEHKPRKAFKYFDKGQMATIGKRKAIAQSGQLRLTGLVAWFAWLFIHILYLVGFRNRVAVLFEWAWNYLFSKRGARLITNKNWKLDA